MIWRVPLSYGCIWEVGRALKKLEMLSAIASSNSYAFFMLSQMPRRIHNSMEHATSRTDCLLSHTSLRRRAFAQNGNISPLKFPVTTYNFTYVNVSPVKCFKTICEMKISYVKLYVNCPFHVWKTCFDHQDSTCEILNQSISHVN